jgi:putative ABC transport system permease protein
MRNMNLGFEKDNIMMVHVPWANIPGKELFRNQVLSLPGVKDLSFSTSPPSGNERTHWGTIMSLTDGNDPNRQQVTTIMSDDRYCKMYGLKLQAGRFFEASDTNYVSETIPEGQRYPKTVVNEKLVKALGFASNEAALGKRFWIGINGWKADIVGVVSDFNVNSLHEAIKPTLITQYMEFSERAGIKIAPGTDVPGTITRINDIYRNIYPKTIFEFEFLDQQLDALYKTEARLYDLFKIFSALAILISCLGLWGLITFAAQQRVKEIGIRKVLGASVPNIVTLLTKDFLVLVCIAIAIASPLAWWGIHTWLQDFAFRIHIGWMVFGFSAIAALLIALFTVSFQAFRAAMSSPVKSLRSE